MRSTASSPSMMTMLCFVALRRAFVGCVWRQHTSGLYRLLLDHAAYDVSRQLGSGATRASRPARSTSWHAGARGGRDIDCADSTVGGCISFVLFSSLRLDWDTASLACLYRIIECSVFRGHRDSLRN